MTTVQEKLFYSLSSLTLGAALFVLSGSINPDVVKFQTEVKQQVTVASIQVFGDQPVFDEVLFVIGSINEFYHRSADEMIAMLTPVAGEQDQLNDLAIGVYKGLKVALQTNVHIAQNAQPMVLGSETSQVEEEFSTQIPANFMQEEPVYGPVNQTMTTTATLAPPADFNNSKTSSSNTWVSMTDGVTGQIYCVGVFNAEVNRYLGPCVNDYK